MAKVIRIKDFETNESLYPIVSIETIYDNDGNKLSQKLDSKADLVDGKVPEEQLPVQKVTVDTALSDTSENPVQNKAVKTAIDNKANSNLSNASGTFGGQVVANAAATADPSVAQVRNIRAGTADLTAGTTTLNSGEIYLQYD